MSTIQHTAQEIKDKLITFLDSFGIDEGGYKVVLELWCDQRFDCGLDPCPEHSTGHRHTPKLEFSRLSKHFVQEKKDEA